MADADRRLEVYRRLLGKLTGTLPAEPEDPVEQAFDLAPAEELGEEERAPIDLEPPVEAIAEEEPVFAAPADPRARRLEILRSMLVQLKG